MRRMSIVSSEEPQQPDVRSMRRFVTVQRSCEQQQKLSTPLGHVVPLILLYLLPGRGLTAGAFSLIGLLAWEHLFVQAPQQIPNA